MSSIFYTASDISTTNECLQDQNGIHKCWFRSFNCDSSNSNSFRRILKIPVSLKHQSGINRAFEIRRNLLEQMKSILGSYIWAKFRSILSFILVGRILFIFSEFVTLFFFFYSYLYTFCQFQLFTFPINNCQFFSISFPFFPQTENVFLHSI